MATISVGGLATGLDTNAIIDQLVALEQRPIQLLQTQRNNAATSQSAIQAVNTKTLALLSAVNKLRDADQALVFKATSSAPAVLGATAGSGAVAGSTTVTVTNLARAAIATSANGVASASATVATGNGTFAFKVGSGAVRSIGVTATTTLAGLADAINDLDAGATASVVNLGTTASPDYRLQLTSGTTGTSAAVSIVTDQTTLGVAVTQSAQNATLTVAGFSSPVVRESNTVADLIPGVTLTLAATGGPVTVSVATDADGVADRVQAVVTAFNDLVSFVSAQSAVTQDTTSDDHDVSVGPLALDSTVRGMVQSLHRLVADRVTGLPGQLTLLAQIGVTTNRDGTLAFDAAKFKSALGSDDAAVAALVGGSGSVGGVADRLHDFLAGVTQAGGLLDVRGDGLAQRIQSLEDQIAAGQRHVDQFEQGLRETFASLEVLVSSLNSQSAFLLSALGRTA